MKLRLVLLCQTRPCLTLRVEKLLIVGLMGLFYAQCHASFTICVRNLQLVTNLYKEFSNSGNKAFFPKQIQSVNMSRNVIEEIGNYYKMFDGFHLEHLDLSFNRISYLDQQMLVVSDQDLVGVQFISFLNMVTWCVMNIFSLERGNIILSSENMS